MPFTKFYHLPDHTNANGPLGYERTPRQPLENEPVRLAAAVQGCTELLLCASVNGEPLPVRHGRLEWDDGGRGFYSFDLGAFAFGSRVEYYFQAGVAQSCFYRFVVGRQERAGPLVDARLENGCLCMELGNPRLNRLYASFSQGKLCLSALSGWSRGTLERHGETYLYRGGDGIGSMVIHPDASMDVLGGEGRPVMQGLRLSVRHAGAGTTGFSAVYDTRCTAVYGLGERFSSVNHIGGKLGCTVADQFTNQGLATYYPVPFYFCNNGHGVFVDSPCRPEFDFGCGEPGRFAFGADIDASGGFPAIHVLFGSPKEILEGFAGLAGKPLLPPKWAFGLWVSANRWNRQSHIEEQLREIQQTGYPANVVVIEAWSDEATFYIWNDAAYPVKDGGECFAAGSFNYPAGGRWPDPEAMIRRLHDRDMKLVLWQIPVLKRLGAHEPPNAQHAEDIRYAMESGLCARDGGGGAYEIPDFWFAGSHIPDFTQQRAREWWFSKRKYLLDMGVDGFKTDGGEFVYSDGCAFSDGSTGVGMKNGYAASYLQAYAGFAGGERALFSRAGYTGSHRHTIHWAGDQQSTWQELRSVMNAGLSAGMSGSPFWSFDIGGFAGPLPTAELYIRSTELAALAPVMQWHSDYMGGQPVNTAFPTGVNDRSPWNVARATGDPCVMRFSLFYAWLHRNLLPHLYSEARKSAGSGLPMMRHLAIEYPDDPAALAAGDQFMLGDLMAAPVLAAGATGRNVYLPRGQWMDFWTGADIDGGNTVWAAAPVGRIPLYLRHGGALALDLGPGLQPGMPVADADAALCLLVAGRSGSHTMLGDGGERLHLCWSDGSARLESNTKAILLSNRPFSISKAFGDAWLDWAALYLCDIR